MKLLYSATLAILLCSCSTTGGPTNVNALAALAGTAAAAGAQAWLVAHPEQRPAFDAAVVALNAFLANGETDQAKFVDRMASLPTASLVATNDAELYVSKPNLIVYNPKTKRATKVEGDAALPVMKATVAGLKQGLHPLTPPVPSPKKKRRVLEL